MRGTFPAALRFAARSAPVIAALTMAACGDAGPTGIASRPFPIVPETSLQAFACVGSLRTVDCAPAQLSAGGASATIIGGQNRYLKLTSSNPSYHPGTGIFEFDVTVQNLLNEAIGTPDGVVLDPEGIRVFFANGPTVTAGTGSATVANPDGTGMFTAANQPYFTYPEILQKDQVSAPRTWQLHMPPTVGQFAFMLYVETDVQYLLVINELGVNPPYPLVDASAEWVELYNAGTLPVPMQGLVFADSAASGRRAYTLFSAPQTVAPGGYIVLGNSSNTTLNGGVPVDYDYGAALLFANSLDAFKISRVVGMDTLTIDRAQYSLPGVSAQDAISRELINPALDNTNMDGPNWGTPSVTAVFGAWGRGTPGAQNSSYLP